jgi:hypothetical protein
MHSSLKKILYNLNLGDSDKSRGWKYENDFNFFLFYKKQHVQSIDKISSEIRKKNDTTVIAVPSYRLCILQLNIEYYISPIMNRCGIFLCILKIFSF